MYLNRSYRLAFILGVVMDVSSREGALILDIEPATYRKRLSRARSIIKNFLASNCGLFHKSNRCRCSSILPVYLQKGRIDPDRPVFFSKDSAPQTLNQLGCYLKEMDELKKLSCIYNAMPPSHFDFVATLKAMLRNKQFSILQ